MDIIEKFIDSYFDFHYGIGLVFAIAVFVLLLCVRRANITKKEILFYAIFSVYITILLGGTLFNREIGERYRIKWIPFWSYYDAVVNKDWALAVQIFYNVLVFVPCGILVPKIWIKMRSLIRTVLCAMFFSLLIELIQLIFKLGLFEFDDLVHNVLGAILGYRIWKRFQWQF